MVVFRAAMKMANIDAVLDFMFTNPRHSDGVCITLLCAFACSLCFNLFKLMRK